MITILNDPAGICTKDFIPIVDGMKLLDWMIDTYGADGFHVPTEVFRDRVSPDCIIDLNCHVDDGCPLKEGDNIIVVHSPQGVGTLFVVGLIIGVAAIALAPSVPALVQTQEVPEFKTPNESPNNSLSGQTNIARPLQKIPDLFGKNLVYPDLILKPYFEFINHVKTQFEYMCIGRGEYLVEDEKTGDTLLADIGETINTIFQPFTIPSELLDVTESNEVNGQDLFGTNIEKIELPRILANIPSASVIISTDSQAAVFDNMIGGFDGTHDGGTSATVMTDSTADFPVGQLVGKVIFNTTDSSSGVITANSATTITVSALTGGSDNQWENGDVYSINGDQFKIDDSNTGLISAQSLSYSGDTITGTGGVFDFMIAGDFFDITSTVSGDNLGDNVAVNVSPNEITCVDAVTGAPSSFVTQANDTSNITVDNPHGISFGTFSSLSKVNLGGGVIEYTINLSNSPFSTFGAAEYAHSMSTSGVFLDNTLGPFQVPGNPEEIWIDIQAPRGLFSVAAVLPIKFNFFVQEVTSGGVPIGSAKESSVTLADNSRDARFYTLKIIPDNPGGFYEISIERVTDSNTDNDPTIGDRTIWTRLAGVVDIVVVDFGDVTTQQVITKATEQVVKVQERQFNAIITRKLPTYDRPSNTMIGETVSGTHDGGTSATVMTDSTAAFTIDEFIDEVIHNSVDGSKGAVISNTATTIIVAALHGGTDDEWKVDDTYFISAPTARVADAAVQMLTDPSSGNKPLSQIDLVSLYDIQDPLDVDTIYGDKLGRFCYSFSNSRTAVNDEVNTALKACRMFKYQEGNVIRFGRDQENTVRKTLFNRRIKKPYSETKSIRQFKINDFDGINLEWVDENTGEGNTVIFPESTTPNYPQRIQAAGVKNYEQAWNLASFEFRKLIFRRTTVTTTVLRDGLLVAPNDKVGNVDSTTLATQDGEVIGINGLVIETSELIDFKGNPLGIIILRSETGTLESQLCAPRTDGVNGFILGVLPTDPLRLRGDVDNYQMGTLYDFAPDGIHTDTDYLVQEIAPSEDNGHVTLTLINYDENVYTDDTETPTPQ